MLNEFKKYIKYTRQLSDKTIINYINFIGEFEKFLQTDLYSVKNLNDTTRDDISNFLVYLNDKKLSKATIANYIGALRSYYKWATYIFQKQNLSEINFFLTNIIKIRKENKIPFVPSREDVVKLRETFKKYIELFSFDCFSPTYKKTVMAYTILELLITTGIRSNELRNLKYEDIDLKNQIIFIKSGKGNHQRFSLFNDSAYEALVKFFAINNFRSTDLIFPLKQTNVLNYMLKRWAKRAGTDPRLHTHSFRHYFITESQRQGVRTEVVAVQVGHENLNSTKRYTRFDIEFLKEQYKSVNI